MMGSLLLPIFLLLLYQVVLGEQVRKVTGVDSLYGLVPFCSVLSALFGALVNFGLMRHAAQTDAAERLMSPLLRQGLGAADLMGLTEAMASALRNVHVVGALLGLVVVVLAIRLPRLLSPATLPDEKVSDRRAD